MICARTEEGNPVLCELALKCLSSVLRVRPQDGAARVLDPIFVYMRTGVKHYGVFFKDYRASPW